MSKRTFYIYTISYFVYISYVFIINFKIFYKLFINNIFKVSQVLSYPYLVGEILPYADLHYILHHDDQCNHLHRHDGQ